MIDDLKPYPAYKDSDVEWLGQVPEHWEVLRLKRIARLNPSKSEVPLALRDGRAVFLPMERVGSDGRFDVSEVWPISDLWNGFTYFRRGDVIVAKITPCFENGKGACLENLPTALGFGSTEFHVIRPSKAIVSTYLYRVTTLSEFRRLGADEMTGAAGQQRVPVEFIANFLIPLPPLPEQTAIVRFLDYMDRRIRRYIRAKQKLIKLLEEYKQALIHQAVTGSIDVRTGQPYPAYKPSGVEWLGEVPEHWDVKKLKYLTRLTNGIAFKPSDWGDHGVPIIRIQNLNGSDDFNYTVRTDLPDALLIRPGDLLFAWSGNRGTSFGSFIWDRDVSGYLNQHIFKLHGYSLARSYFAYLLRAVTRHVEQEQTHGIIGLVHVTKPMLGSVVVPVAPSEEQVAITGFIDRELHRVEMLREQAKLGIDFAREYRTRLIADVVTCKVDVREVAARLPEEPPEEEAESMDADEIAGDEATDEEAGTETVEEEEVEP